MEKDYEVPQKKPRTKLKVVKEWVEEDVFKLIALVEGQVCLWNASDEGYHNKTLRDNAWQNICDNFDAKYCSSDLSVKWTNLRIQYRGYAARPKTKSGQGAMEPPKWKYFNAMCFVGRAEEQQTQITTSNIVLEVDPDITSIDCSISTPPLSTARRSQLLKTQQATSTQIAETMREAVAVMKERSQNAFDPNISFTNYLLSELKTLSDDAAANVRKRVTLFFLQCVEEERKENC